MYLVRIPYQNKVYNRYHIIKVGRLSVIIYDACKAYIDILIKKGAIKRFGALSYKYNIVKSQLPGGSTNLQSKCKWINITIAFH